ncbi:class I SAM-dependent methyltransferase [Leptothoe spongobia]|uniref:Class I SAM-dependent methyltransferase n=1 Tax=Leptothoe spongobia TAU-MAC 1115 TaxID=1967444 RepID=A0A947GIG9_9CYAN|nr:class I SAM-dependent methyltransferase [Leptothoe spongobia]MBT9315238.1 class I SAM-dependent methyltransferase [Leptothoe spongobia TAU-MAC 1115]
MLEPSVSVSKSRLCTQLEFESKTFQDWLVCLREKRKLTHRKSWEYCFILQTLYEQKLLCPGISGLGFGVGREPLVSLFCSRGASICATDLVDDMASAKGWIETSQHASGLESLNLRNLCPDDLFHQNCTFRNVDMNQIPNDLQNFDFIWSSCSLEHLGTLSLGEQFIYNAMNCLKPGGLAIHTTEYNVSSNFFTIRRGDTALYRRRDIKRIARNLRKQGHKIDVDFTLGTLPKDSFIDLPPYKHNPHLKLKFAGYVITSIGLVIKKAM